MSAARPLVSVITPFLDAEPFLADAIASVRAQRYDHWELLLVDDGSADGSPALAHAAAAASAGERIRVLTHPDGENRGRSASRNLALEHARGELVAFLDADDLFLPTKLEQQVGLLHEHPDAQLVYGSTLLWHSPRLPAHRRSPDLVTPVGAPPGQVQRPPALVRVLLEDEDAHPTNCSLLVRRSLCEEIGGFDTRFELYEDTVFLVEAFLRAPALVSGDCSAVYRLHPDSTCHRAEAEGAYDPFGPSPAELAYLEWVEGRLATEAPDEAVARALRRRLRAYRHPARHALATSAARARTTARHAARRAVRR